MESSSVETGSVKTGYIRIETGSMEIETRLGAISILRDKAVQGGPADIISLVLIICTRTYPVCGCARARAQVCVRLSKLACVCVCACTCLYVDVQNTQARTHALTHTDRHRRPFRVCARSGFGRARINSARAGASMRASLRLAVCPHARVVVCERVSE